ncbi:Acetylornithine deacetylase [Sodalis praecaptivus]|nr:Acetylornithine deacetylase [Sodalis praecaptivus]
MLKNGAGPCFAFNTHIDVVPAGEGWSTDPFTLVERDGRLYGRGACDAKGPLVAMLEAMRLLAAHRAEWSGTLMGVFVADEDVASEGAKFYVNDSPPAIDFAVISEPTSNATFSAHKGSLRPLVRVHGVTAHSGTPELGENAIFRAAQLLGMIEEEHQHNVRCRCHPLVGSASLTVTRVHGGHADNVLPGSCDLLLDRRMVPGEDETQVKQDIDALLALAQERFGVRAEILRYQPTTGGATETDSRERIVQAGLAACRAYASRSRARSASRAVAIWYISAVSVPKASSSVRVRWRWRTSPMNLCQWTNSLPPALSIAISRSPCCPRRTPRERLTLSS